MRVSVFCCALLLTSLQLLAVKATRGQGIRETSVNFGVKNASLNNALKQLQTASGITFFYPSEKIVGYNNVSVTTKTRSVETVLELLLSNTDLDFKQQNNVVVIFQRPVVETTKAPNTLISGHVVDERGQPLPGVSIRIKGGILAWTTNSRGEFTMLVEPKSIFLFSYIGYITREIPASQLKNPALIELKEDIGKLDEVQVIAYGTTTKRENTGDVTTIDQKTLAQYPTVNALDALQGTVSGLAIYKNSGNANATYKVRVRGINGITGAQPLYVVDGIPYQGGGFASRNLTSGANTANGTNGLSYDAMSLINPDDIESISVLKDADATSIYGSRGADGVILITTKKGKIGATHVETSIYTGISQVPREQSLLNREQYLQMRREAYKNDGQAVPSIITNPNDINYDINGKWDTTRSTNWQKELIGGAAHNTKAQLSISGGTEQVQFRINGGYNYANTLERLGGTDQSGSLNFNINTTSKNKSFTAVFTGGYFYDVNTIPQYNLIGAAVSLAPDAPALYTPTGDLNFENNTFSNPMLVKNYLNRTPQSNLTSSLALSYKPIADLELRLTSGYNKQIVNEFLGAPSTLTPPYQAPNLPSSTFTYNNANSWSIEPQVNYNKELGKGKLSATVGASLQSTYSSVLALAVSGYAGDVLLSSPTAGTTITPYGSGYYEAPKKNAALFGRVNYNWADKYYINLSARDDGSSNFGPNNQYHIFASVGAGWIFSEENLIKKGLPFLSFGKLRASYGSTGRDAISPFAFQSTYTAVNVGNAYGGVAGLKPNGLPNPDLSWEATKKAELGIELQFLQGRIALISNYYRNRTTGVLAGSLLSYVTGFNSITTNMPATIQNKGFDVSLTTTNIKSKSLSWSTTILFTRDRNSLVDYPNLDKSSFANTYIIGQPVNIIKTYRFGGVNPQTGIYQILAANGTMTGSPNALVDRTQLININPDFYGSVQNNISYKRFTLSFLFRYIKQVGKNAFGNIGSLPPGLFSNTNFSTVVLNRWQKPGDITNIQRFGTNFSLLTSQGNAIQSDAAYGDASYIRLQNAALNYTFPHSVTDKLHMQNLQVFVQGENLLTITGYNGYDPETQSAYTLPPLRVITAGLRLTL